MNRRNGRYAAADAAQPYLFSAGATQAVYS
jgi:hypothetical protein